jgi:dimeric dUTPase (all-alpha-NTP-PPase superfamily)
MRSDILNIQKLFELQRQLDKYIEKEHPRQEGEDRLAEKILALQVELGELAQEWRGFKFWSNDREPRTYTQDGCEECVDGLTNCEKCIRNPLLEEYVDCLHFILSIGLDLEITDVEIDSDYTHEDPSATFVELFGDTWEMFNFRETHDKHSRFIQISIYERMFNRFVGIGEKHLGFTWEQIEEAYMKKNAVNHSRQESGY